MKDLTKKEERKENREIEKRPKIITEEPKILEEIEVEQISVDGICGVY